MFLVDMGHSEASHRSPKKDIVAKDRVITACSWRGHKCITTRTRHLRLGEQYLAPGGSWRWCSGDCRDSLRREVIDFWDEQQNN